MSRTSSRLPRSERRESLLAAAREVFVATGYHAAAMDEIAARAGVTKPVLYQHFGSKRDLYLAALDSVIDQFMHSVGSALASTDDNRQRVAATIDAYLRFISHQEGAYRLIFQSDLVNAPDVRQRMQQLNARIADLVSHIIAADTDLDPAEALLLAYGLLGLAETGATQWLNTDESTTRAEAAHLLSALAWRGISGFPRSHPPRRTP